MLSAPWQTATYQHTIETSDNHSQSTNRNHPFNTQVTNSDFNLIYSDKSIKYNIITDPDSDLSRNPQDIQQQQHILNKK